MLAGFALRTYCYARNHSLWIDEAFLALNVVYRTVPELCEPLDLNQGAPLGYLLLCKLRHQDARRRRAGPAAAVVPRGAGGVRGVHPAGVPDAAADGRPDRGLPVRPVAVPDRLLPPSSSSTSWTPRLRSCSPPSACRSGGTRPGRGGWSGSRRRAPSPSGSRTRRRSSWAGSGWRHWPTPSPAGTARHSWPGSAWWRRGWSASGCATPCSCASSATNEFLLDYWAGKFMPFPPTSPGDLAWLVDHFLKLFEKPGGLTSAEFAIGGLSAVAFLLAGLVLARERMAAAGGAGRPAGAGAGRVGGPQVPVRRPAAAVRRPGDGARWSPTARR